MEQRANAEDQIATSLPERLNRALGHEAHPGAVVRTALDALVAEVGAAIAAVLLFDEASASLRPVHTVNYPEAVLARIRRVPLDAPTISGQALRTGEVQTYTAGEAITDDLALTAEVARDLGIEALAAVPLLASGRRLGVLTYGLRERHRFDAAEVERLRVVGDVVAGALERVRLETAVARWSEEAELLSAIAVTASGEMDLGRILTATLDRLGRLIRFTGGAIALIEDDQLVIRAAVGRFAADAIGQRLARGRGAIWRVIETREPFLCNDLERAGLSSPSDNGDDRLRSYLAVPLIWRGEVFGLLEIDSVETDAFRPADVKLLQAVAAALSGPIELTRRYAREQHLRAEAETARARLAALFVEAPAILAYLVGPEHRIVLANARAHRLFGYRPLVGQPARAALAEIAAEGWLQHLDRAYTTGEPYVGNEVPLRLDRRGDEAREPAEGYVNVAIQPVRDANGAVEGLLCHAVEVTDSVLARRRLERIAAEQNAILSQIADGVVIADPAGTVIFANEAARTLYGVEPGTPPAHLLDAAEVLTLEGEPLPREAFPLLRAALHGETVVDTTFRLRRRDGSEIIAQGSAVPVLIDSAPERPGAGPGPAARAGAVLTLHDVTAERTLDQQKIEFLSTVSHDLKNPLVTIKGLAQLLQRRVRRQAGAEAEWLVERLGLIDQAATRMTTLINELVDVARLQMAQPLELRRQPTDLVALAHHAVEEHRSVTERHTLRLEAEAPELIASVDAPRLERVLANLLLNAIKYSPNGGEIVVRVAREAGPAGDTALIAVRDQGVGIQAGDLAHVFERFRRGSNVAGRIAGAGIGLAGAKQIVEQHGGSITAESAGEGRGATFTVHLPLAPPASADAADPGDYRANAQ